MLEKQLKRELKNWDPKRKSRSRKLSWLQLGLPVLLILGAGLYPLYRNWEEGAPERMLNHGGELESAHQFETAEALYQQLSQDYAATPQAPEALYRLARIEQYNRQNLRKALLWYLRLEKAYPDNPLVHATRRESARISKYSLGDFAQAISFYERLLLSGDENGDRYLFEIADCYFQLGNYVQARIELEILGENYPDSPLLVEALYRKGGLLVLEGRNKEAGETWTALVERYPESIYRSQAEFDLAKLLEEDGRLAEALKKYQEIDDFPQPQLLEEKIEHLKKRIAEKKKAV